jgi:hypothetical protein
VSNSPRGDPRRRLRTCPRGVEMLDVAMAEYVVAVRREPFSGLYDQAS